MCRPSGEIMPYIVPEGLLVACLRVSEGRSYAYSSYVPDSLLVTSMWSGLPCATWTSILGILNLFFQGASPCRSGSLMMANPSLLRTPSAPSDGIVSLFIRERELRCSKGATRQIPAIPSGRIPHGSPSLRGRLACGGRLRRYWTVCCPLLPAFLLISFDSQSSERAKATPCVAVAQIRELNHDNGRSSSLKS